MGLDAWLTKKHYIWKHDRAKIGLSFKGIDPERISGVTEEIMYWRKQNAIHKWFVDNVQNGNDDCKDYIISVQKLAELLKLVKEALESRSKAKEILPTQSGFFFGGTEYDDWYWQGLEETERVLSAELEKNKDGDEEPFDYYYSSSW